MVQLHASEACSLQKLDPQVIAVPAKSMKQDQELAATTFPAPLFGFRAAKYRWQPSLALSAMDSLRHGPEPPNPIAGLDAQRRVCQLLTSGAQDLEDRRCCRSNVKPHQSFLRLSGSSRVCMQVRHLRHWDQPAQMILARSELPPTIDYHNHLHLVGRFSVISIQGLNIGTYNNHGFCNYWYTSKAFP